VGGASPSAGNAGVEDVLSVKNAGISAVYYGMHGIELRKTWTFSSELVHTEYTQAPFE
jgi:hypothetical protein